MIRLISKTQKRMDGSIDMAINNAFHIVKPCDLIYNLELRRTSVHQLRHAWSMSHHPPPSHKRNGKEADISSNHKALSIYLLDLLWL